VRGKVRISATSDFGRYLLRGWLDEFNARYPEVSFAVTLSDSDLKRSVFLRFDGASTVAEVFVNGKRAGEHRGGFGAFCFDVTEHVHRGENVVAVRVNNAKREDVTPLSGDFTIFGGIYRDVHLLTLSPLSVSPVDEMVAEYA